MNEETTRRYLTALQQYLGETISKALDDSDVTEIMVNSDGSLWVESQQRGMERLNVRYLAETREAIIATVASLLDTVATREHPVIEGELPFSHHRFAGSIPPVAEAPQFVIRKHDRQHLTIDDYVKTNVMTKAQAEILYAAIERKDTILISGGTGSGKTTIANALLTEIARDPTVRVVLVEDTRELQCQVRNLSTLRVTDGQSLAQLTRHALRLRPDRLVIGEVRGPEAYHLLNAWNTGHRGGITTLHANSASAVFLRLALCVRQMDGYALPPTLFAEAINLIVHIHFDEVKRERKVTEIARVRLHNASFRLDIIG